MHVFLFPVTQETAVKASFANHLTLLSFYFKIKVKIFEVCESTFYCGKFIVLQMCKGFSDDLNIFLSKIIKFSQI